MQISRNYRTDKAFLQLTQGGVLIALVVITLLELSGCAQIRHNNVAASNSRLPVADSYDLPVVIKTLISQSDDQYAAHNLADSLATLERAIRINPRIGEIWSRMAQIYFEQGKFEQASQHAKRSNSVIKNNPQLKVFNDSFIVPSSTESVH